MARRWTFGLLLFAVLGCRTCDNPYDYCGPVVESGHHPVGYRAGGGMSSRMISPDELSPEEITPPPAPPSRPSMPEIAPEDAPPTMRDDTESTSAMRSRLRYAR
jgi:hypothetical protein